MASTPVKRVRPRRSPRPPYQPGAAFAATPALSSKLIADQLTATPDTPELDWLETPPTTNDPLTPPVDSDLGHHGSVPESPLAARKQTSQNKVRILDDSEQDSDIDHLLSTDGSQPGKLLFRSQSQASNSTAIPASQLAASKDEPAVHPEVLVKVEKEKDDSPPQTPPDGLSSIPNEIDVSDEVAHEVVGTTNSKVVADVIKSEDAPSALDNVAVADSPLNTRLDPLAPVPSKSMTTKKPLTLSFALDLGTKLSEILPYNETFGFEARRGKCVGIPPKGSRCTKSTQKTFDAKFVTELFNQLVLLESSLDLEEFAEKMTPLIEGLLCESHNKRARDSLHHLAAHSWRRREIASAESHQTELITACIEAVTKLWISALKIALAKAPIGDPPTKANKAAMKVEDHPQFDLLRPGTKASALPDHHKSWNALVAARSKKRAVLDARSTFSLGTALRALLPPILSKHLLAHSSPKFGKYDPQVTTNVTPQALIRKILLEPLTKADMKRSGFIYVFGQRNSKFVKIGYAENIKERLKEWRKCWSEIEHLSIKGFAPPKEILYLHKIESLIHAELKEDHMKWHCATCGAEHHEWFRVDAKHALQVVEKWTSRSFYSENSLDETISKEQIDQLCELLVPDLGSGEGKTNTLAWLVWALWLLWLCH